VAHRIVSERRVQEIRAFSEIARHAANSIGAGLAVCDQAVLLGERIGAPASTVEKWLFAIAAPRGLAATAIQARLEAITSAPLSTASRRADQYNHVVLAQAMPGFLLRVRFADGQEGTVDLSYKVKAGDAGAYAGLVAPMEFARATIEDGNVIWPSGVTLLADEMHERIKEGRGTWRV
jgi:hypothetical protein